MSGYDGSIWSDFALGQVGASAALLGLVIVGLSINLRAIIASKSLVNRAGEAVVTLGSALAVASAVLIPDQSRGALGAELIALAVLTFGSIALLQRAREPVRQAGEQGPPRGSLLGRRVIGLGAQVLLLVAGVTLALEAGGGLYWWPGAVLAAYAGALLNVWVLSIEILR